MKNEKYKKKTNDLAQKISESKNKMEKIKENYSSLYREEII